MTSFTAPDIILLRFHPAADMTLMNALHTEWQVYRQIQPGSEIKNS